MIIDRIYSAGNHISERREYESVGDAKSAATQLLHRGWYIDTAYPRPGAGNCWYLICMKKWDGSVRPLR